MATSTEFKNVLDELKTLRLFNGHYDALHGSPNFMNGISTVMEYIADRAGDEKFIDEFDKNFQESIDKAYRP